MVMFTEITPAHQALWKQIDISFGLLSDRSWKCLPGLPRNKWLHQIRFYQDQIHFYNSLPPADLWRCVTLFIGWTLVSQLDFFLCLFWNRTFGVSGTCLKTCLSSPLITSVTVGNNLQKPSFVGWCSFQYACAMHMFLLESLLLDRASFFRYWVVKCILPC